MATVVRLRWAETVGPQVSMVRLRENSPCDQAPAGRYARWPLESRIYRDLAWELMVGLSSADGVQQLRPGLAAGADVGVEAEGERRG